MSTSCSTLDSTDTLCNTADPPHFYQRDGKPTASKNELLRERIDISCSPLHGNDPRYSIKPATSKTEEENAKAAFSSSSALPPSYNSLFGDESRVKTKSQYSETDQGYATQAESQSEKAFKPILTKSYPGRVVSCTSATDTNAVSDYNKALRYADQPSGINSKNPPSHWKSVSRGVSGTGDPSDSKIDLEKNSEATESCKPDTLGVTNVARKCQSCGTLTGDAMPVKLATSENCHTCSSASDASESKSLNANAEPKDPGDQDLAEDLDQLKPLFSDAASAPDSNITSSHGATGHSGTSGSRERTVSSSSTASDGWGVSSELIHKYDYFRIVSTTLASSVSSLDESNIHPAKGN